MKKKASAERRPIGMSNALTPDLQRKRQKYRNKRKITAVLIITVAAVVLFAAAVFIFGFMRTDVTRSLTIEAGDEPVSASDFFDGNARAFFVSGGDIDTAKPGKYPLTVRNGILFYNVSLTVQDTVAPTAKSRHVRIKQGKRIVAASDFVKSIKDKTEVTARFESPVDYNTPGDADVTVILTDLGGNETRISSLLTIYPEEVNHEITIEAGYDNLSVRDFLAPGAESFEGDCILTELDEGFVHKVGSSKIQIMYCSVTYTVTVTVEDTKIPAGYLVNQATYVDKPIPAEKFITKFYDETPVTVRYAQEPDFSQAGAKIVELILEDGGKNIRTYKATLTVMADTVKPQIEVQDRTVFIGDNIRFTEGVTVTDNCDNDIKVEVDTGDFDKNTEGVYLIKFKATDKSGNTAVAYANFTLKTKFAYQYTQELIDSLYRSVYSKIIGASMTQKEKAKAIYDYVRANIAYNGTSEKSDWEQEAYRGLRAKAGDAFTFYSISRKLLTMAGIENKEVTRIKSDSSHYWNMIMIDGEWYHFDTCPHYKEFPIDSFMLTDSEAAEYSKKTNGYYTYK